MQIYLTKYLGYCHGVSSAIEMAKGVRNNYYDKNVYIFGELVHNQDVTKELSKYDIETLNLSNKDPIKLLNSFSKDDIVIFTAHGHNKEYDKILHNKCVMYFDAICPRVKENNRLIKEYLKTNQVIYIGKKNHPETEASLSIDKNIHFYDLNDEFIFSKVTSKNPLVINQTTISVNELKDTYKKIKDIIPSAIFSDEICPITRLREEEIINIPNSIEMILIIGSSNSSNTDKLFKLAVSSHPSSKVIKIQNLDELKKIDLTKINSVALSSGTSTPMAIIKEIEKYLQEK